MIEVRRYTTPNFYTQDIKSNMHIPHMIPIYI